MSHVEFKTQTKTYKLDLATILKITLIELVNNDGFEYRVTAHTTKGNFIGNYDTLEGAENETDKFGDKGFVVTKSLIDYENFSVDEVEINELDEDLATLDDDEWPTVGLTQKDLDKSKEFLSNLKKEINNERD